MTRPVVTAIGLLGCLLAAPAAAGQTATSEDKLPSWMIGVSGGTISRDGDDTHADGTVSLTRRLGKDYVRLSAVRFGAAVDEGAAVQHSTYTIGFLSGGTVLGHWFVDGYAAAGIQHYGSLANPLGTQAITGSQSSGVYAGGIDGGYVKWLGSAWSLTPSLSAQYVRSQAIQYQPTPAGPQIGRINEDGITGGATLRLDRWLGADRQHDIGIYVSGLDSSNASAPLISGARGDQSPTMPGLRSSDAWLEAGANASVRLSKRLYLDVAGARTVGLKSGDVTTSSVGARIVF